MSREIAGNQVRASSAGAFCRQQESRRREHQGASLKVDSHIDRFHRPRQICVLEEPADSTLARSVRADEGDRQSGSPCTRRTFHTLRQSSSPSAQWGVVTISRMAVLRRRSHESPCRRASARSAPGGAAVTADAAGCALHHGESYEIDPRFFGRPSRCSSSPIDAAMASFAAVRTVWPRTEMSHGCGWRTLAAG